MDDSTLLTLATGPTSSLVLLLGMGLAGWRFFAGTVVPSASRWVDSHLAQVDRLIDEHAKDRQAWLDEMQQCRETSARIERKVGGLYGKLDALQQSSK
mgnify:FL=1|jgi:hypothetical protein